MYVRKWISMYCRFEIPQALKSVHFKIRVVLMYYWKWSSFWTEWGSCNFSVNSVITAVDIVKLYCVRIQICFEVLMVWNVFKQNFLKTKELPLTGRRDNLKTKLNFCVRFKYWWLLATSYKRSMCFWRKFSEWEEEMQKKGKLL